MNKKLKIAVPVCIAIVLIVSVSVYLIILSQEEASPSVLELFSLDKIAGNATGPWEGLGNLTIRYNGNITLEDTLSIQVFDSNTGREIMTPQSILFVEPGWNMTIENINTNVEHVVMLTYKDEVLKLVK